MSEIELKNVGAISELKIPLPKHGGVVVLNGRNGTGKSTAIAATSALLSGTGKPPLKDGEKRGFISGCGATIQLGATLRRNGEAEAVVDHIEGKFSIAELVDPKYADPKAADKIRIKSLLTVRGVEVKPELFVNLFPNEETFLNTVSKSSIESTDPVEMSTKVKRDVESAARTAEQRADNIWIEYEAEKKIADYNPDDLIEDIGEFNRTSAQLGEQYQKLSAEKKAFASASENIERAKKELNSIDIDNEHRRIEAEHAIIIGLATENEMLKSVKQSLVDELNLLQERIKELSVKMMETNRTIDENNRKSDLRKSIIVSIEEKLKSITGYQDIIEQSAKLKPVDDRQIDEAYQEFTDHNKKLQRHTLALEGKRRFDFAETKRKLFEEAKKQADELRRIAKDCENVLTELIGDDGKLFIEDGRMLTNTGRGKTFYADLSDGERWRLAFQAVVGSVRKSGELAILTIPQRGWESLDPKNQTLVNDLAKEYGLCILTAEATDGELNVQPFDMEDLR
jgi:energy-coupling factor transporter ATP-binding protein EcfA2